MASINANTTSGLIQTGDLSGTLLLQGNGVTGITITAAGIPQAVTAANSTATSQIATTAFAVGAISSLSNGYQLLPSGLLIQWGAISYTGASDTTQNFNYPIAFSTVVLAVTGTIGSNLGGNNLGFQTNSLSSIKVGYHNNSGFAAPGLLGYFFAIGV